MWPAALITAGAAAFGRLFVVGILPSAVLTVTLWATISADAFDPGTPPLFFSQVIRANGKVDTTSVLLFLLVVTVFTALLQNFQIPMVRFLEGYWGASSISVWASAAGVRRHRNRRAKAAERYDAARRRQEEASDKAPDRTSRRLPEQAQDMRQAIRDALEHERATLVLLEYPPLEPDLMPTRLGNALRSAERTSGERYGWSTVHAWPRLYSRLPEALAIPYRSAVDAVDAAAAFCLTFLAVALIGAAAFYNDPKMLWFPVIAVVLAFFSYRGAVIAVMLQRSIQHAAFDLHRFDLIEALHLPLPDDPDEESVLASELSRFFAVAAPLPGDARRRLAGRRYAHAPKRHLWQKVPWKRGLKIATTPLRKGAQNLDVLVRHHRSKTTVDMAPSKRKRIFGLARSMVSRRPRSSRRTEDGGRPSSTTGQ